MKSLQNGRYFVGVDMGGEDTTGYWLVPVQNRQLRFEKAVSMTEDEFRDFMSDRSKRRLDRIAKRQEPPK